MNSDWFESVRHGGAFEGPFKASERPPLTRWARIRRAFLDWLFFRVWE